MSLVLDAIAAHARRRPHAAALSGERTLCSYVQLQATVERTAAALAALAPARRPRPVVAIMLDNGPAWAFVDLALIRLGWPSVPIPAFFTGEQVEHALADAGADMLLRAGGGPVQLLIEGEPIAVERRQVRPVALPAGTAKVTYTSGSTGRPKGVCLSQGQMEAVAASLLEVVGPAAGARHLPLLPFSILLENVAGLYATLLAGGCCHVLGPAQLGLADPFRPDPAAMAAAIAAHKASSLILVPELLRLLVMALARGAPVPADLAFVAVGGAKTSPRLLAQAAACGLPVYEGYGLSECASVVALNTPGANRPGAVGRPLPHLSVAIGEAGEILVGPDSFLGYTGEGAREGLLHTGDLGRIDEDGFLHVEGRIASTIISAFGRNISPEWVESELTAQPEIGQALVFGDGAAELGALVVPLSPEIDDAVLDRAVRRANDALPPYARVGRWRRRAPFDPRRGELTGNGRIRRQAVLAAADLIDATRKDA